jgi:peroxiredoxin
MKLPENLPVPQDDGACDHLKGLEFPSILLRSTNGRLVDLAEEAAIATVVFFYPRTGTPSEPAPLDWDLIPGARGCTPQSCGFRDLYSEFRELGFRLFGASSQTTEYQEEFVSRNHIPFEILSDADFKLTDALGLPTFVFGGSRLIKRLAIVLQEGRIAKVFYPVFPPNENAANVLTWIRERK